MSIFPASNHHPLIIFGWWVSDIKPWHPKHKSSSNTSVSVKIRPPHTRRHFLHPIIIHLQYMGDGSVIANLHIQNIRHQDSPSTYTSNFPHPIIEPDSPTLSPSGNPSTAPDLHSPDTKFHPITPPRYRDLPQVFHSSHQLSSSTFHQAGCLMASGYYIHSIKPSYPWHESSSSNSTTLTCIPLKVNTLPASLSSGKLSYTLELMHSSHEPSGNKSDKLSRFPLSIPLKQSIFLIRLCHISNLRPFIRNSQVLSYIFHSYEP